MHVRGTSFGIVVVGLIGALVAGCGDDDANEYVRPKRDAGADRDADAKDASEVDGAAADDAGVSDAAVSDADTDDSGAEPVNPCELSDEDNMFAAPISFMNESQFSLSIGTTGFGVAYRGGMNCGEILAMPVQASGSFPTPANMLGEGCLTVRDLAVLREEQGWRVVWVDNSADTGAELQTMILDERMNGRIEASSTRLSNNALREEKPILAKAGDSSLVVYAAVQASTQSVQISSHLLDGEAAVREVVPEADGHKPSRLALLKIGPSTMALAWVADRGNPGVWLQKLDLEGAPQGAPVRLSDVASAGATVDLAARDAKEGGAILYSSAVGGVNHEVRMMRIGPTGVATSDERKIIGAPLQARDASFARLGGGYAVAYRALPGGPITQPEIRLTFISKEGNVWLDSSGNLMSYKIADVSEDGGRVTLRVSNDGQLLIGFVDGTNGSRLRLVRKRLDCAL